MLSVRLVCCCVRQASRAVQALHRQTLGNRWISLSMV
jgi:hypothetical protein